jgi:hypothetical protein
MTHRKEDIEPVGIACRGQLSASLLPFVGCCRFASRLRETPRRTGNQPMAADRDRSSQSPRALR